ncbi:MAG: hypothetical protein IN805_05195 [Cutibacterium sp.]|nr:hypothetical protein [Cutibacterium sp.]MCA3771889.1 hypothetical protein [Cutibacterium sp.]
MKWSAVVGGTAALAPVLHETKDALANKPTNDASTFVWSACTVNCGSRCPLRLEVKDGTISYACYPTIPQTTKWAPNKYVPACEDVRFATAFTIPTD